MPGPHKNSGELAKQQSERTNPLAVVDSAVRAAANMMTFGYADKFAAWMDSTTKGTSQEENLAREKAITALDAKNNPKAVIAGQVAGVVLGPLALKSAYGFSQAVAAGYAGATVTASVTAMPAVTPITLGERGAGALHSTAKSFGSKVASNVRDGVTMVRERPIDALKVGAQIAGDTMSFVTKQVVLVGGSMGVNWASGVAPVLLADTSAPATDVNALKVDDSVMVRAGGNAGAAVVLGLLSRGRSGWFSEVGKGISLMAGSSAVVQGGFEALASTSAALQEKEYGIAAQSAGYIAAATAVAQYKQLGLPQIWNYMVNNRTAALLNGVFTGQYLVDSALGIQDAAADKVNLAHVKSGAIPDGMAVSEKPVSAADPSSVSPTYAYASAVVPRSGESGGTFMKPDPVTSSGIYGATLLAGAHNLNLYNFTAVPTLDGKVNLSVLDPLRIASPQKTPEDPKVATNLAHANAPSNKI